jgi:DNA modification methylase
MAMTDIKLYRGDCLDVMKLMSDNSVDSVVTDPPYELGFMGKKWDSSGISYSVDMWREVLRVLKPGGHLLSFGGTRTYHRMACAIEDSGFEIRDQIQWIYGSGFPKSYNIGKNCKGWDGWGSALKPANEPICLARKPLSEKTIVENVLKWGTGGINIDGCRLVTIDNLNGGAYSKGQYDTDGKVLELGLRRQEGNYKQPSGRFPANVIIDEATGKMIDEQSGESKSIENHANNNPTDSEGKIYGIATYKNFHKSGAHYGGRGGASRFFYSAKASQNDRNEGGEEMELCKSYMVENGSKTSGQPNGVRHVRKTMQRNNHPTVKPTTLMRYLCRLITPPDGIILDPFMGSGSTGKATILEGFNFIGIEKDEKYFTIAEKRIAESKQQMGLNI